MARTTIIPAIDRIVDEFSETVRCHGVIVCAVFPRPGQDGWVEVYRARGGGILAVDVAQCLREAAEKAGYGRSIVRFRA